MEMQRNGYFLFECVTRFWDGSPKEEFVQALFMLRDLLTQNFQSLAHISIIFIGKLIFDEILLII